jgi:hypothetical protein
VTANEELDKVIHQDRRLDEILLFREHEDIAKEPTISMLPDGSIEITNLNSKPPNRRRRMRIREDDLASHNATGQYSDDEI